MTQLTKKEIAALEQLTRHEYIHIASHDNEYALRPGLARSLKSKGFISYEHSDGLCWACITEQGRAAVSR